VIRLGAAAAGVPAAWKASKPTTKRTMIAPAGRGVSGRGSLSFG
jgi:hypothetical protein